MTKFFNESDLAVFTCKRLGELISDITSKGVGTTVLIAQELLSEYLESNSLKVDEYSDRNFLIVVRSGRTSRVFNYREHLISILEKVNTEFHNNGYPNINISLANNIRKSRTIIGNREHINFNEVPIVITIS